jgi:hypothetical protein
VLPNRLVDLSPHLRRHATRRLRASLQPSRTPEVRPDTLANLRRLATFLETAALLERRADRETDARSAGLLRERAEERRHIAEELEAHLAGRGLPRHRRP